MNKTSKPSTSKPSKPKGSGSRPNGAAMPTGPSLIEQHRALAWIEDTAKAAKSLLEQERESELEAEQLSLPAETRILGVECTTGASSRSGGTKVDPIKLLELGVPQATIDAATVTGPTTVYFRVTRKRGWIPGQDGIPSEEWMETLMGTGWEWVSRVLAGEKAKRKSGRGEEE